MGQQASQRPDDRKSICRKQYHDSVESGLSEAGKWLTETRNVYEDYRCAFGEDPPEVGGIAIMIDSDDTGESAAANYGPITVCSQNPGNQ